MPLSKILPSGVSQPTPVNAIINGNMSVAQRGTSSTGVGGSDGYFTCDRWRYVFNTSGRLTSTQDSSAPSGFANSMKLDCTTADTSIAHLSATLEKSTWIVLPFICDWRWFKSDKKTIWYKKANLYRQKKNQNWKDPFINICRDIKNLN